MNWQRPEHRLALSLYITLGVMLTEFAGGILSHSLALLSDAGHMLTDAFALGLSLIALGISKRPTDQTATFGYHRVGLLAALINGGALLLMASYIFIQSYRRFIHPPGIDLAVMLPIAILGLVANVVMALILGHDHRDLNIKSAWMHIMGDTLSSVGVIASGAVIYFTGWIYADPLVGFLIGLVIAGGGARLVREALLVFLDFVPRGFDAHDIAGRLRTIPGVRDIHDLHLRSLTHGKVEFSAHLRVDDQMLSQALCIRQKAQETLKEMGIAHIVIQLDLAQSGKDALFCRGITPEDHGHSH